MSKLISRAGAAWRRLDTVATWRRALWLAPLLAGLVSLAFGQDDNWDLHNYHLYNPFALLNGKVGYDLAPAQWQSYFNPTLDLLYYGLVMHLPAPLAGFLMGALQGCNFLLVMAIAGRLLPAAPARPYALMAALALAGCLGPGFLSELGNTMGDNITALAVLGALLLVLRHAALAHGGAPALWSAGLLMGCGAGLKLTNAVYALALCLALFALDGGWRRRCQAALRFGAGVLGGIALTAGHWYWRMWQLFGNPLFPQFNDYFRGPLAAPIGIGDTGWLPRGALEKWLWPFVHTLWPRRVSELPLRHLLWPMLYVAFAALALTLAWRWLRARRGGAAAAAPMAAPVRLLLVFTALSYLFWLNLFSIYRYLVPIELLAPLVMWLLLWHLLPPAPARAWGLACVALAACSVLSGGGWSHARWSARAFAVQTPDLPHPEQNLVFIVHGEPPMGWLVPFFPARLAFVSLGAGFPESPAYRARVRAMLAQRGGPFYVMVYAEAPPAAGWPGDAERERAAERARQRLARGAATLAGYGLALDAGACRLYPSQSGNRRSAYQWCVVAPRP